MADIWKVTDYQDKKRFYEDQKTFERNVVRLLAYEYMHGIMIGRAFTSKTLAYKFVNNIWDPVDCSYLDTQVKTYVEKFLCKS